MTAPNPPKELSWRRRFAILGDVWVEYNPLNKRYRWRCPTLPQFKEWSYSEFRTHEDAFEAAKEAFRRVPHLVRHTV